MKHLGGRRQGGSLQHFGRPAVSSQHRSNRRGVAWFMVLGLLIMALSHGSVRAAGSPLVAYLKNNNVFFIPAAGSSATAVTTRGHSGANGLSYPWYQWSPSGRYMLLVRQPAKGGYDLLLINRQGDLVRTLLRNVGAGSFYPTWAIDADVMAYSLYADTTPNYFVFSAYQVDLHGRSSLLWKAKGGGGCDFGTGDEDPALPLYLSESPHLHAGMSWSATERLAVYRTSPCPGVPLNLTDFLKGTTVYLGDGETVWRNAALSRDGRFVASIETVTRASVGETIVVADAQTGSIRTRLGSGTSPVWSSDFRHIYYSEQRVSHVLPFKPDHAQSPSMISTIWSVTPSGTERTMLLRQPVYVYGRIQPTPDGRSLIFSSVDNCDVLWQHRLPGDTFDANLLKLYGPHVRIQKLDIGGALQTLAVDGGTPVVG